MQLFFVPEYDGRDTFVLNKEESSHIVRVLRMKEGAEVNFTDGKGKIYSSVIVSADANHTVVKITGDCTDTDSMNFYLHLAFAPTKNINRIEWLVEKAVELGISEITPVITAHSERKNINIDRLDKIIVSAMKQSLKSIKPKLNSLTTFSDFTDTVKENKKLLCTCIEGNKSFINQICRKNDSVLIAIGPEGDFSKEETLLAENKGFNLITLGNQRLRTETAAFFAISNIHIINQ